MTGQLWTPPDGEYAKAEALKAKQAACSHHFHLLAGIEVETKLLPAFPVVCCHCDLEAVIEQEHARFCKRASAHVEGRFKHPIVRRPR